MVARTVVKKSNAELGLTLQASNQVHGFSFESKLKERNALRLEKHLIARVSENGLHYSWNWGGIHFIQLNLYPGNQPHPETHYSPQYHDPQQSLDFLRSEPTIQEYPGTMDEGDTVDNYLHEAALADAPLSGTFYDPEGDGVRMESLGVHEHWNNPVDRLYSGNLDPGTGIELIQLIRSAVPVLQMAANGAALDFEWNSRALEAKKYDLVAATNLAEGDWLPYNDAIRTYENILPSGTGINILTNVLVNGSVHFFRVVEKPSGFSYLAVTDGGFEGPPDNVDQYVNWRFCHASWNPTVSGNEFQLCSPGHLTTPADGSWTALMSNLGTISQNLGEVNAGDTLTVIFYGGRAREGTNTAGGGVFNCTLRVGGSFNTVHADTRAQAADTWQAYTNTWVSTATGTLSIEFSNVSGIPWIDNISDVKREE